MNAKYPFDTSSANISIFESFIMKVAILLYLLACLCEIQLTYAGGDANFGFGLDPYRNYIRETKNDVKNKSVQLKYERITTFHQLEEMLQAMHNYTRHTLEQRLLKIIKQFQESFSVAAANGRDVERCIEFAANDVNEIERVIKRDLQECVNSIIHTHENHEYFKMDIDKEAMEVYNELDYIFPECEDISLQYKCVSEKVAKINVRVQKLKKYFNLHFNFYESVVNVGYAFGQTCIRESRDTENALVSSMIVAADKCVDNA